MGAIHAAAMATHRFPSALRAERGGQHRTGDPGRIVRWRFVGVIAGEVNCIAVAPKRRGADRPRRHQRVAERRGDLVSS